MIDSDYYNREASDLRWFEVRNACSTAMNIMDGMSISGDAHRFKAVTETWAQGFLELTMELSHYAVLSERTLAELQRTKQIEYPGVYDYEVSYEFGKWFANQIITKGRAPTRYEGEEMWRSLAEKFFNCGGVEQI